MNITLEQNYISVVLVIHDFTEEINSKIKKIEKVLKTHFKASEFIIVDNTLEEIKWKEKLTIKNKYTIIKLPIKHSGQKALNAGIAMAIGDYIVEIEDLSVDIDYNVLLEMYKKSQESYDFIFLIPKKVKMSSIIFYKIINHYFKNRWNEKVGSSLMILSSRRGQNKISELGNQIINRNLAYILSGLKSYSITVDLKYKNKKNFSKNLMLMFDSLLYYTDILILLSQGLSFLFLILFIFETIYCFILEFFYNGITVWIFLSIIVSLAFCGIFFMLSIITRYLHHILKSSSQAKSYTYSFIDKQ